MSTRYSLRRQRLNAHALATAYAAGYPDPERRQWLYWRVYYWALGQEEEVEWES